jgi:hypothetical protein
MATACGWRVSATAILIVCACTPTQQPAGPAPAVAIEVRAPAPADLPVITTIRTRDREVVVFASSAGLRFTVRDELGTVLADRVDHAGFSAAFPVLGEHFDTAFAGEHLWIDASAGLPVLPPK